VVGTSFGQIPSKDHKKIFWWVGRFTTRPKDHKKVFWWSRVRNFFTTTPQENLLVGVGFRKFHHKTTRKSGGGGNSSEIFTTRTQENLVVYGVIHYKTKRPQKSLVVDWGLLTTRNSLQDHKKILWWESDLETFDHKTTRKSCGGWGDLAGDQKTTRKSCGGGRVWKNFTTRPQENLVVGGVIQQKTRRPQEYHVTG
jgi:hypothetical protein